MKGLPKSHAVDEIEESYHVAIIEPTKFHEAVKYSEWKASIKEEVLMIEKNEKWELAEKPAIRKPLELSGSTRSSLIQMVLLRSI